MGDHSARPIEPAYLEEPRLGLLVVEMASGGGDKGRWGEDIDDTGLRFSVQTYPKHPQPIDACPQVHGQKGKNRDSADPQSPPARTRKQGVLRSFPTMA